MAITLADFNKIWASTSPLTPYSFSESNYKQGWNFIGSTPPARQMWDFLQKQNDEKMQYIVNDICVPTEIDETSASGDYYSYPVPSGKVFANFDSIGGKTIAWNQLINPSNMVDRGTIPSVGLTLNVTSDGAIVVNGTSLSASNLYFYAYSNAFIVGHKFIFADSQYGTGYSIAIKNASNQDIAVAKNDVDIFTLNENISQIQFVFDSGVTFDNLKLYPQLFDLTLMFGSGNEPASASEFQQMFPATVYSYNAGTLLSAGVSNVISKDSSNNVVATMPIPSAVQSLEGYGWSAGSVYNYIDFERKVFVKRVGKAVLDGSSIAITERNDYTPNFRFSTDSNVVPKGNGFYAKEIASPIIANVRGTIDAVTSATEFIVFVYNTVIYITEPSQTMSVAQMNTWLQSNPVTIYYELATPIETDISSILGAVGIACGNTLTFNYNANYRLKVPVSMDLLDGTNGLMTPQDKAKLDVAYGALSVKSPYIEKINLTRGHLFTTTDWEETSTLDIPANCAVIISYQEQYAQGKPTGTAISDGSVLGAMAYSENQSGYVSCANIVMYYSNAQTLHFYGRHAGTGNRYNQNFINGVIIHFV